MEIFYSLLPTNLLVRVVFVNVAAFAATTCDGREITSEFFNFLLWLSHKKAAQTTEAADAATF
jgi:hypothetical protein